MPPVVVAVAVAGLVKFEGAVEVSRPVPPAAGLVEIVEVDGFVEIVEIAGFVEIVEFEGLEEVVGIVVVQWARRVDSRWPASAESGAGSDRGRIALQACTRADSGTRNSRHRSSIGAKLWREGEEGEWTRRGRVGRWPTAVLAEC